MKDSVLVQNLHTWVRTTEEMEYAGSLTSFDDEHQHYAITSTAVSLCQLSFLLAQSHAAQVN